MITASSTELLHILAASVSPELGDGTGVAVLSDGRRVTRAARRSQSRDMGRFVLHGIREMARAAASA